jgi:NAD(P)H-hydrate repair Nnr-like enzyme with NAD(P)H-hydrate dehydratase domain
MLGFVVLKLMKRKLGFKQLSASATAGSGDVLAGIIGALVATNYIEILNRPDRLAEVAATGAYIHNLATVTVSKDVPISATSIISFIPAALQKILK